MLTPAPLRASTRSRVLDLAAALPLAALLLTGCTLHTPSDSEPVTAEPQLTTVTRPHVEYGVPAGWKEDAQDNVTHVIGGETPDEWVEHQDGKDAIIQWNILAPPTTEPAEAKVREAIDAGLANMQAVTPEEIAYLREAVGLGCVGAAEITDPPHTEETGQGYALRYGYTCPSAFGPTQAIAITAYGWDGRKHSFNISTTQEYWDEHAAELEATADSFRITK